MAVSPTPVPGIPSGNHNPRSFQFPEVSISQLKTVAADDIEEEKLMAITANRNRYVQIFIDTA